MWQPGVGWRLKRRFPRWHFYGCFKISAQVEEPFNLRVGSYRLHLFTLARQLLARRARLVNFTFITPIPADTPGLVPRSPRRGGSRGGPGAAGPGGPRGPAAPPQPPGAFPVERELCHLSAAGAASSPSRRRSVWERLPAKRQAINADSSPRGGFLIATSKTLREKAAETRAFLAESAQAAGRARSIQRQRSNGAACLLSAVAAYPRRWKSTSCRKLSLPKQPPHQKKKKKIQKSFI